MKRAFILLCCFICAVQVVAQQTGTLGKDISRNGDDPIIDLLLNKAFALYTQKPDSALILGREALKIAEKNKNTNQYASALNIIGLAFDMLGIADSAVPYISGSAELFHKLHNPGNESHALMNLASVYESVGNHQAALQHLNTIISLSAASKDLYTSAMAEKMIGIIYRKQGYNDKAKQYLEKAVSTSLSLNNLTLFSAAISSLGSVYLEDGLLDSAAYCYHKALNASNNMNDLNGIAIANESMGIVFLRKGRNKPKPNFDSALFYFKKAFGTFRSMKNNRDMAYELLTMSDVLIAQKQYPQAEKYLKSAIITFDSLGVIAYSYNALQVLSSLYDSTHDYKNAYYTVIRANSYNDSLNKKDKDKAIADMLVKYESDKKDNTIALLNTRNALAERQLSKTRITEFFSFLLTALLVGMALLIFNRSRIKQRLKELQLRNQIASDLHDEVGSSLSSIMMLGKMGAEEGSDRLELINKISANAADVMEQISDIVWATNPRYDDGKSLQEKIENYVIQIKQMSKPAITLEITSDISTIKFPMDVRKNIILILKEAINNMLKHANASLILIEICVVQKRLQIKMKDNGIGFNKQAITEGNGLETMLSRTESIGGKFKLTSDRGSGTEINITIPIS